MNTFSPAFTHWLENHGHSLRAVAISAGIANGELSRIRTGAKAITFASLCKLLPAVETLSSRTHARTLLIAYLHDETPPAYESDVSIQPTAQAGQIELDAIAGAAARWESKARTDAEFARMWLSLDGYMHDPEASQRPEAQNSEIALLAEPQPTYGSHGGGGYHDTIRHDASPMRAAASKHTEP